MDAHACCVASVKARNYHCCRARINLFSAGAYRIKTFTLSYKQKRRRMDFALAR
jgi:hypothetical protein